MMAASPSGDLYATQAQVARLEELVTKQQATLENIENQKTLFQQDLNTLVQQVIEEATSQRGIRSLEYANITKFITKQFLHAMSQIQDANTRTLQESIPLKKLQELEKRLLTKPTATEDTHALAIRISDLEARVTNGSFSANSSEISSKVEELAVSNTELATMKEHVQHLETVLLQEVQRAYKTVYKPGEYGAPLTKLQSQVDMLQQDMQRMKSVDSQTMAEALITSAAATIRHDFQDHMATRASQEDLNKFQSDIKRIEEFSRDVQTGFYAVRNQCTSAIDQMNSKFTESRWLFLQERLTKSVKEELEKQSKGLAADFEFQRREIQKVLDSAENTVKSLNSEVRSQYGPEMLQRYLTEIQQNLQRQQTEFQTNLESSLANSLDLMRKEIQVMKSYSADFTATVRSELTGSKLLEKFAIFEDRLETYQTEFSNWTEKFAEAEETNRAFFETLYQQKVALRTEIQDAQTTLETLKNNQTNKLTSWYQERKEEMQGYMNSVGADADTLRAEIYHLKDEVRKEIEQQRDLERYKEYQKATDAKIDLWTAQKEDYLYSRMVDVQGEVRKALKKVDEREAEFTALFSEETLREFVQECETRLKAYQEGWNRRRMEEYSMRYSEIYREVQHISDTMNTRDKQLEELFSEARLQELVQEGETRLKRIQDAWMERKTEELQLHSIRNQDEIKKAIHDIALREEKFDTLFNETTWDKLIKAHADTLKQQYDEWVRVRSTEFYNKYNDVKHKVTEVYDVLASVKKEQETMLGVFTEKFLHTYLKEADHKINTLLNKTILDDYFNKYEATILKENTRWKEVLEQEVRETTETAIKQVEDVEHTLTALFNETTFKKLAEEYTAKLRTMQYEWHDKTKSELTTRIKDIQADVQKTIEYINDYNMKLGSTIDQREIELHEFMKIKDREIREVYNKEKLIKFLEEKLTVFGSNCEDTLRTTLAKQLLDYKTDITKQTKTLHSSVQSVIERVDTIEQMTSTKVSELGLQFVALEREIETNLRNELYAETKQLQNDVFARVDTLRKETEKFRDASSTNYTGLLSQLVELDKTTKNEIQSQFTKLQTEFQPKIETIHAQTAKVETFVTQRLQELNESLQKQEEEFKNIYNKEELLAYLQENLTTFEQACELRLKEYTIKASGTQREEFSRRYRELQEKLKTLIETVNTTKEETTEFYEKVQSSMKTSSTQLVSDVNRRLVSMQTDVNTTLQSIKQDNLSIKEFVEQKQMEIHDFMEHQEREFKTMYNKEEFTNFLEDKLTRFGQECETRLQTTSIKTANTQREEFNRRYRDLQDQVRTVLATIKTVETDNAKYREDTDAKLQTTTTEMKTELNKTIADIQRNAKGTISVIKQYNTKLGESITNLGETLTKREKEVRELMERQDREFKTIYDKDTLIKYLEEKVAIFGETCEKRLHELAIKRININKEEIAKKYMTIQEKVQGILDTVKTDEVNSSKFREDITNQMQTTITSVKSEIQSHVTDMQKDIKVALNNIKQYSTTIGTYLTDLGTKLTNREKDVRELMERQDREFKTIYDKTKLLTELEEKMKIIGETSETRLQDLLVNKITANKDEIATRYSAIQERVQRILESVKTDEKKNLKFREEMTTQLESSKSYFNTRSTVFEENIARFEKDCNTRLQEYLNKTTKAQDDEIANKYTEIKKSINRVVDIVKTIETNSTKFRGDISEQIKLTTIEIEEVKNEIKDLYGKLEKSQGSGSGAIQKTRLQDLRYAGLTKCFYTAIFGKDGTSVDTLAPIEKKISGWDYICFTNLELGYVEGWNIIKVPLNKQDSPILQAKLYKWLSHKHLEDYDVVIWMDAYISPNMSYRELLKQWIVSMMDTKTYMIHRPHDTRNCVYLECDAVVEQKRDTKEHVDTFRALLKKNNIPKNTNLFDTNIVMRFHKNEEVQEISEAIVEQLFVEGSTYRDQLVIPYVYHMKEFKGFRKENLLRAFDKVGTHVRKPA